MQHNATEVSNRQNEGAKGVAEPLCGHLGDSRLVPNSNAGNNPISTKDSRT